MFHCGAKRDCLDLRDKKKYSLAPNLPKKYQVSYSPLIKDQGQTNSCTGHAATWFWEQVLGTRGLKIQFSPYFTWYFTRKLEGTEKEDRGCSIRETMSSLNKFGAVQLDKWDYSKDFRQEPDSDTQIYASGLKLPVYERCEDLNTIKYSIAIEDQSVLIGISVFNNWIKPRFGVIDFPEDQGTFMGLHAVTVCGYDDTKRAFKIANSWGNKWKEKGFAWISYDYILKDRFDAWTCNFSVLPNSQSKKV